MSEENKRQKRSPKLCTIECEWENCQSSVTLIPAEYETFSDHLKVHADEFVSRLRNEADDSEDKQMSCCCMWRACSWEGCEDLSDLIRHIMFHGYHALLKALGGLVQSKLNLNECSIEVDDQYHMISCVTSPFICCWRECNTEYLCPDKYYRHVEKHITDTVGVNNDANQLKMQCCWKDCNNQFRDKHKLKEHVRVHTHEKLMACSGCGGLFSNRTKLLDHLSRQNAEAYENFQCSHCLKRCASERLLRDHMRHHVNYLKCPHCDMTCPNPGSLKYHIHYRHSDDRPFMCNMCDHSFKSNSDLIRHEESHLQKSYVCTFDECDYSTKTAHCLRRHVKITHSGGDTKRYVCHICNRAYSRGFGLTKHLKKQHNFSWPSGHPRFRYIEYDDGLFRLQMVRFESAELTKRLKREGAPEDYEDEEVVETEYAHEDENDGDNIVIYNGDDGENDGDTAVIYISTVPMDEVDVETPTDEAGSADITAELEKETSASIPITVEGVTNTPVSTINSGIYLQPKPPGYDATVMSQLMAMATKPNSSYCSSSNDMFVNDLYQQLVKASKENELKNNQASVTMEHINESEPVNSEHTDVIIFDQVAYIGENQTIPAPLQSISSKSTTTADKRIEESLTTPKMKQQDYCSFEGIKTSPDSTTANSNTFKSHMRKEGIELDSQQNDVLHFDDNKEFLTECSTDKTEQKTTRKSKRKSKTSDNSSLKKARISTSKKAKLNVGSVSTTSKQHDEMGEKFDASEVLLSLKSTSK